MEQDYSLLEREWQFELAGSALRCAREGDGGTLLFEGGPGLGKTSLLQEVRSHALSESFCVLHARGNEFESEFPWSVAQQLFDFQLDTSSGKHQSQIEQGGVAEDGILAPMALNEWGEGASGGSESKIHATLRNMYWFCRKISARQPLLLVVDDVDWADTYSLRFVSYLVNRLEGNPILVALTNTPREHTHTQNLLMSIRASPVTRYSWLAPLSAAAVREAIAARFSCTPEKNFVQACHDITEGNPLHVTEILEDMASRGLNPGPSMESRVRLLTPTRMTWHTRRQVSHLPEEALALASAIAVLGDSAEPRHCSRVARLDDTDATEAAGKLRDAKLIQPGVPYSFGRPILRQVIYTRMTAKERDEAHWRAARSLRSVEADDSVIADHLLQTDPASALWAVEILRSAARDALQESDPRSAMRYLSRALAEPPADPALAMTLAQLGSAELRARNRSAVDHLAEALRRWPQPEVRLELAHALAASGRSDEAITVLGPGSDPAGKRTDRPVRHQMEMTRLILQRFRGGDITNCGVSTWPEWRGALRSHAAAGAVSSGVPARRVRRLASAALQEGIQLGSVDVEWESASIAAWTLGQCDDLTAAEHALASVVHQASSKGHLLAGTTAESLRAMVLMEAGRIKEAKNASRTVIRDQGRASLMLAGVPLAAAALVHCLIEQQRSQEAEDFLGETGLGGDLPDAAVFLPVRLARGRLRIRLGRTGTGLNELRTTRELAVSEGWWYPSAMCAGLSETVRATVAIRGESQARSLASAEVTQARTYGAAGPLAMALRTYGELVGGEHGRALLEEADQLLADNPRVLERARTLISLGSAMRRAGSRTAARQHLAEGLKKAHECDATDLESIAKSELRLAGARFHRSGNEPYTRLTPAEERVAHKAASGLSNKEISQTLFITVKTVEWHLSQVYVKLGIRKRAELSHVLTSGASTATPEPLIEN